MDLKGIEHSLEAEDLICYGFDASGIEGTASMVAWPRSTDEVARLVRYADQRGMSIVGRGAGTGMTAGAVPLKGAMVVSFERMNRLLELDKGNMTVVVEPGMINGHLQKALAPEGLFYPPDPASLEFCTLGGNVLENAGGPRALKYGVTRDYVMELEAVLPSGEVVNFGIRTHKGVVGYDMVRLLVGSEGTLALVTKIRLKLLPQPEDVVTLLCFFDRLEDSGRAVSAIMASRIIPRTLEFIDRAAIKAVESYRPAGLPSDIAAMLLVELDGHHEAIRRDAESVADICQELGGNVEMAADEDARERLWATRRAISPSLHHLKMKKINEDVVVPRDRMTDILLYMDDLSGRTGIPIVNFGHAGDGNIHVNIMGSKEDPEQFRRAEGLVKDIFAKVLELGGTISGEHGVGLTKAGYISMEIHPRELELMRQIKNLFDPRGIMNPGKIFP